jgi:hypothetical protein
MTQTIQVVLHDNKAFTMMLENYNADELETELNNPTKTVVKIGQLLVNRNSVKLVVPTEPTE